MEFLKKIADSFMKGLFGAKADSSKKIIAPAVSPSGPPRPYARTNERKNQTPRPPRPLKERERRVDATISNQREGGRSDRRGDRRGRGRDRDRNRGNRDNRSGRGDRSSRRRNDSRHPQNRNFRERSRREFNTERTGDIVRPAAPIPEAMEKNAPAPPSIPVTPISLTSVPENAAPVDISTLTQVGIVSHFFSHVSAAAIKVERTLSVGEEVIFKGPQTEFRMRISSLEINRAKIAKALKGVEVGILVPQKVAEGDLVYRISN